MKRADAGKGIAGLARHADVAELGVIHPEDGPAAHDAADTDAGAHRHVRVVVETLSRAPAALGQRRAIHVGVDAHRYAELAAQPRRDVGIAPVKLAGRGDESVGWRSRLEIDRA